MTKTTIELTEFKPITLASEAIPLPIGEKLWREYDLYGGKIRVEFPGPPTNGRWRLTAQGWVGHIPLTPDLHLVLQPKVSLNNLFGMWEYAYGLKNIAWLAGLTRVNSLAEFYEQLATILAQRVLERGRQGFHRTYVTKTAVLPYVRGRLKVNPGREKPGQVDLPCHYEEHTADISDNQILAYTLYQIARSHRCHPEVQQIVRRAYQATSGVTAIEQVTPMDCIGRSYTRLNQDYQPLHALCRFFLEQGGPGHTSGNYTMLPFLINMEQLYELFVAEWLKKHLPPPWRLKAQEKVHLGQHNELLFAIDLVIYDEYNQVQFVLDTKYKTSDKPENPDFNQMVTYAKAKNGKTAVLIYPSQLLKPLNISFSGLHVRSLTFALGEDLEKAGQRFLTHLLTNPENR